MCPDYQFVVVFFSRFNKDLIMNADILLIIQEGSIRL